MNQGTKENRPDIDIAYCLWQGDSWRINSLFSENVGGHRQAFISLYSNDTKISSSTAVFSSLLFHSELKPTKSPRYYLLAPFHYDVHIICMNEINSFCCSFKESP